MAKSHSERVLLNTGAGTALKLVAELMSFVLKTVFIYTLGKQYNGVSTLFTDILHMLSLAELGVGSAITFALYKPIKEGDDRRVAALMHFYRRAYHIIALVVLLAGTACVPFLGHMVKNVPDIKEDIRLIFMLYVINSASSYLRIYRSTLLTASERHYVISRISIYMLLARTAVACVLVVVFRSFILYLLTGIAESLVRNVIVSRKAAQQFPNLEKYPDAELTREETKRLLRDVGALMIYKVCQVVLSSTDSIVISWLMPTGVVTVGLLGNYRMLYNTITKLYSQFFTSFRPSLGVVAVDTDPEKQYSVFRTITFMAFWFECFVCTSLLVLSTPFIRDIWFDKSFVLPISIIGAMTFNFYLSAMGQPNSAFRDSNGLFVQGKYRPLFMAIANIALDIVLIGPLGIFGVLLASGLSRLITQTWYDPLLLYRTVFKRPVREYWNVFLRYSLTVALCCAGTYALSRLIGRVVPNRYVAFMLRMIFCAVIPNGAVILLFGRTEEYRDCVKRLKGMGKKILRKFGLGKKKAA